MIVLPLLLIVILAVLAILRDIPRAELERIRSAISADWFRVKSVPEDFGREGLRLGLFLAGVFDRCVQ